MSLVKFYLKLTFKCSYSKYKTVTKGIDFILVVYLSDIYAVDICVRL